MDNKKIKNEHGFNEYVKTETNWKDYYGSSKYITFDVNTFGQLQFKRKIIMLCNSKFDMMYHETKQIIDRNAIYDQQYYNLAIYCRLMYTDKNKTKKHNDK